jgi:hypothetical protein
MVVDGEYWSDPEDPNGWTVEDDRDGRRLVDPYGIAELVMILEAPR